MPANTPTTTDLLTNTLEAKLRAETLTRNLREAAQAAAGTHEGEALENMRLRVGRALEDIEAVEESLRSVTTE